MKADLHVHTTFSKDGKTSPAEAVKRAKAVGLGCIALTDHNATGAAAEAGEGDVIVIPGIEVTAKEGHIIVLGVGEPIPKGLGALEVCDRARSAGAVVIIPHPYRWITGVGEKAARAIPSNAMEGINGRSMQGDNVRSVELCADLKRPTVGGSDAHVPEEIGVAYTNLSDNCQTVDGVLDAIRKGKCAPGGTSVTMGNAFKRTIRNFNAYLNRGGRRL
ncbi:MAG: PHP domain-containing protein [Euryarchaeota archaeon]|nr:PHP domain-containing protein [Euryarchaeota archaeon]